MKLFVFGATGDLVRRKVLPALIELNLENLEIVALGRKNMTTKEYLGDYCFLFDKNFQKKILYKKIDFEKELILELKDELDKKDKNYFYISLPPKMIKDVLIGIKNIFRGGFAGSVLIEKPFGYDFESAVELKKIGEEIKNSVFLADHYLFKEESEQMAKKDFRKIKFVFLEKVGFEGRGYYDEIGAIRDMIQSHFLNLLFKIKPNIKHDLKMFSIERFIRKQYTEYESEIGKKSDTETFIDLTLKSQDKEFEFISGKAFDSKQSCVFIDNEKINFNEQKNPYVKMFKEFIENKKENFPNIDDAIFSWELIEWVLKQKPKIEFYKKSEPYIDSAAS